MTVPRTNLEVVALVTETGTGCEVCDCDPGLLSTMAFTDPDHAGMALVHEMAFAGILSLDLTSRWAWYGDDVTRTERLGDVTSQRTEPECFELQCRRTTRSDSGIPIYIYVYKHNYIKTYMYIPKHIYICTYFCKYIYKLFKYIYTCIH